MDKYILEGKIPVLCDDLEKLEKFFKEGSDNWRIDEIRRSKTNSP